MHAPPSEPGSIPLPFQTVPHVFSLPKKSFLTTHMHHRVGIPLLAGPPEWLTATRCGPAFPTQGALSSLHPPWWSTSSTRALRKVGWAAAPQGSGCLVVFPCGSRNWLGCSCRAVTPPAWDPGPVSLGISGSGYPRGTLGAALFLAGHRESISSRSACPALSALSGTGWLLCTSSTLHKSFLYRSPACCLCMLLGDFLCSGFCSRFTAAPCQL